MYLLAGIHCEGKKNFVPVRRNFVYYIMTPTYTADKLNQQ